MCVRRGEGEDGRSARQGDTGTGYSDVETLSRDNFIQ